MNGTPARRDEPRFRSEAGGRFRVRDLRIKFVADMNKAVKFYRDVLGLKVKIGGIGRYSSKVSVNEIPYLHSVCALRYW